MFEVPPLFKLIQEQSNTDWKEMYQVFNCGHRMELYVKPDVADAIIAISKSYNVDAQISGTCRSCRLQKIDHSKCSLERLSISDSVHQLRIHKKQYFCNIILQVDVRKNSDS